MPLWWRAAAGSGPMETASEAMGAPVERHWSGDDQELIMKFLAVSTWRGSAVIGLACLLPSAPTWAQEQVASQSGAQSLLPADVASVVKPGSTAATKPHDDGFVIGNGDVLAI